MTRWIQIVQIDRRYLKPFALQLVDLYNSYAVYKHFEHIHKYCLLR